MVSRIVYEWKALDYLDNISLSIITHVVDVWSRRYVSQVLDLGFNGIRYIPDNAFVANPLLTLLALDGNPMSSIPIEPFKHLKSTLRGLSVGGMLDRVNKRDTNRAGRCKCKVARKRTLVLNVS
ncbi:hypothetical protein BIW11_08473 [Tropilaelaps mercedesae]|uniref:Uncharacterized protein n=1 Tax=Tropilaelaps mercedesae TaxID=418985 RepID=A0A1V9XPE3_9ACAR|nr:hypothetical protein BIW11_08473 [Tropilaelaps mercedesae]